MQKISKRTGRQSLWQPKPLEWALINRTFVGHFTWECLLQWKAFYQEAGRAGRDKNLAICNVIFSEADPEQTDNALSGEGNLIDLRNAATKLKRNDDDVSRALFFHLNAFSGIAEEYESVSEVLGLIGNLDERKKVVLDKWQI